MLWAPGERAVHQYAQQVYSSGVAQLPVTPHHAESHHHQAVTPSQYSFQSQMQYEQELQASQQVADDSAPLISLHPILQQPPQIYDGGVAEIPVFDNQDTVIPYLCSSPDQMQYEHEQDPETLQQVADSNAPLTALSQPQLPVPAFIDNQTRAQNCFEEFERYFGGDPFNLRGLKKLCQIAGIVPPTRVKRCRKALSNVHMNIFDVVEIGGRHNAVVQTFPSRSALYQYGMKEGKLWPRRLDMSHKHLLVQLMWNFDWNKRRCVQR